MAIRSITQLKTWFRKGAYPLASQFADWVDSYWHKEEKIPINAVEQLADRLNGKYDVSQAKELQKQVENAIQETNTVRKDVKILYTNIEELEVEDERLDGRITSGDEATLQSANGYTDTAIAEERVVRESAERTTLESAKSYADQKIAEVVGGSPETLDTLQELAGALGDDPNFAATMAEQIGKKVDKVEGKGLSTEDFTTPEKAKLAGVATGANNYTHPASHLADMIEQSANRRFVTDTEKAKWNGKADAASDELPTQNKTLVGAIKELWGKIETSWTLHSVSYADLVALRDANKLRPGHHYRITDFVTTVANDAEARSAGHPFDIIVLATAADKLSEEARAIVNENYAEYFGMANLAAWKVWYCLDNDISRFQWADETNGRGVIYRLIDEWQNDCPYDFKNVQFKRYRASASGNLTSAINGRYYAYNGGMTGVEIEDANDFVWAYTFTLIDDDGQWRDFSITKDALDTKTDWGYFKQFKIGRCEYNHIRNSYTAVTVDEKCYRALMLNNIVLIVGIDANGLPGEMQLNTFGDGNYNMTLKDNPERNHFGNKCYNNIVGSYGNTFGNNCWDNTFGNDCWNNTFGNNFQYNTFGNGCAVNTFGNNCWDNTFGNDCWNNTFGNGCTVNTFGNGCTDNTFGNYLRYITVNDGIQYVSVVGGTSSSSYVQNAQILNGTSGSSSSNRLSISFKANVKYCQFAGLNSSGILKIWTPADLV